jgi:hypothetical protein
MERCVVEEVSYDERDSEGGCVSVMGSLNSVREYPAGSRSFFQFPFVRHIMDISCEGLTALASLVHTRH